MISSADTILSEGLELMRSFVASAQKAPDLTRGGVLVAFQPQISGWTDRAEAYLVQNPGTPLVTQSKIRSAVAMGDDIADQSPAHVNSLLTRLVSFLGSGAGPAPTVPQTGNISQPPSPTAPNAGNSNMLILLVVAFLVLKG